MKNQIILFGAGNDGIEAVNFFGNENILCFADNKKAGSGNTLLGKKIISAKDLEELLAQDRSSAGVIISVISRPFAIFQIAEQLRKMGIEDFSIYKDIKRHWNSGREFIERDREIVPCEQQTLLEIYKYQRDYFLRHADPLHISPAVGGFREEQLWAITETKKFFDMIADLNIKPYMDIGTLLGAVRHGVYVLWDDDLDFSLEYGEYKKLVAYCEKT